MADPLIRVTVVVPFHNVERYIERCITALLTQDYPADRYEILMVDNNSTDRSAAIVRAHPRIRLVSEPVQGAYAARNRGVAEARGEIVAFTDPDCVPACDWLREVDRAMSRAQPAIVLGRTLPGREGPWLSMLYAYEDAKNRFIFGGGDARLYCGWTSNMAVRRRLFGEIGPFAERRRGSDTIFVHRVAERYTPDRIVYVPDIRVRHLEVLSTRDYLRKVFVYGRSSRKYRAIVDARPLGFKERWTVFRNSARRLQSPMPRTAAFLALLVVGLLCWTAGNWTAARAATYSLRRKSTPTPVGS